jgi:hypothetical protein
VSASPNYKLWTDFTHGANDKFSMQILNKTIILGVLDLTDF